MRPTETEQGHSPFEETLRTIPIPTCKAFLRKGKPAPVGFAPKGTLAARPEVAASFPKTISAHKHAVLVGTKPLATIPKGKRVAVLFSGGPAAGGHNVLVGIKAALGKGNTLFGVKGGPKGFLEGKLFEITEKDVKAIINTGGFDFLGTDRTKIKTAEQLQTIRNVCNKFKLDAIVIVGGDDSNTNAAILAEQLLVAGRPVQVIGVPKTMDGDVQCGKLLPISFGFDTATRVYGELVGNILQDTKSSRKYWHFVRLMGRDASHVTLEVALQTKPTIALISEEVATRGWSLNKIVDDIAQAVVKRSEKGMNYGLVIVPEGLLEYIPEINALIAEISAMLGKYPELERMDSSERIKFISARLSSNALFLSLPQYMQAMFVANRDAHGNVTVSQIETERLLVELVAKRVKQLSPNVPFATNTHFFGYEGRCGAPTLFDASLTYNLGLTAGSLVLAGKTSYMAAITDLEKGGSVVALPLTGLIALEQRKGAQELVIRKALVRMDDPAFKLFASRRAAWSAQDLMSSPGPRQYFGPTAHQMPISVALNQKYKSAKFKA